MIIKSPANKLYLRTKEGQTIALNTGGQTMSKSGSASSTPNEPTYSGVNKEMILSEKFFKNILLGFLSF
jgi:hypothetical protein